MVSDPIKETALRGTHAQRTLSRPSAETKGRKEGTGWTGLMGERVLGQVSLQRSGRFSRAFCTMAAEIGIRKERDDRRWNPLLKDSWSLAVIAAAHC